MLLHNQLQSLTATKGFKGGELIFVGGRGRGAGGVIFTLKFFLASQPVPCDSLLNDGLRVDLWRSDLARVGPAPAD